MVKKLFSIMILSMFFALLFPINTFASEKDLNVPIEQDYKTATFIFEFGEKGEYLICITEPNGEVIEHSVNLKNVSILLENVEKGDYKVHISSEKEINVKAKVECSNTTISEVGDNITVSSSLTNLDLFFIDGKLNATWENTGIGKVRVFITDPKTLKTLHNFSTEQTSFEVEIEESVSTIEVYLVPASNSNIEGAGVTYTIDVVRELNGKILDLDYTVSNKNVVVFEVELEDDFTIVVENGEKEVYRELLVKNDYSITVPLNSGVNYYTVYLYDMEGNAITKSFSIEKDIVAPTLSFEEHLDGLSTKEDTITLTGVVSGAEKFFVNNVEIEFASNGYFSYDYALIEGMNNISVCAADQSGNETVVNLVIERKPNGSAFIIIVPVLSLLLLAGLASWRMKKLNAVKNDEVEEKTASAKKEKAVSTSEKKTVVKKDKKKKKNKYATKMTLANYIELGFVVLACVAIVLFMKNCLSFAKISSGSMEPTLMTGERAFFNKVAYVCKEVERGDIITYISHEYDGAYFTKRVIGIGGDEISFADGNVFINGVMIEEPYIADDVETNCSKTFLVPEGHVFVMGDNRENSTDSRSFKQPYISIEDIYSKYLGSINILK